MNCREAQHQIFAERDGASAPADRAALESHVAHCAGCRRIRDDLTAALTTWRAEAANVSVPDIEREWHAIRRRIRGGVVAGAETVTSRSHARQLAWFTIPLATAAACALALIAWREDTPAASALPVTQIARADYVEAPGRNASIVISVDDKSGWLFVVASDAPSAAD